MSGICSGFVTAAFILIIVMVSYLPLPDEGQLGTYLRSFFVYRYRSCTINAPNGTNSNDEVGTYLCSLFFGA